MVNRRGFIGGVLGLAAAARAATAAPSIVEFGGAHLTPDLQQLARRLSEDVFNRARRALRGRRFTIVNGTRAVDDGLDAQWNMAVAVDRLAIRNGGVDMDIFRACTGAWVAGQVICPSRWPGDVTGVPLIEALASATRIGQPMLPKGVLWTAHLRDERLGFVMRAVMTYDLAFDNLPIRWDVISG